MYASVGLGILLWVPDRGGSGIGVVVRNWYVLVLRLAVDTPFVQCFEELDHKKALK